MNDTFGASLRDLLPDTLERFDDEVDAELRKDPDAANLPGFARRMAIDAASESLRSALDGDVFEWVAKGWCQAAELREYTDPAKHPPRQLNAIFLGEHAFTKHLHPWVRFDLGHGVGPTLRFTLELKARFRAVALLVRGGHIIGLRGGEAAVVAQLSYRKTKLHPPRASTPLRFPARLMFDAPGWPIARSPGGA